MLILDNHNTMTPAHQKKKKKKHYDTGFKQRKKKWDKLYKYQIYKYKNKPTLLQLFYYLLLI